MILVIHCLGNDCNIISPGVRGGAVRAGDALYINICFERVSDSLQQAPCI